MAGLRLIANLYPESVHVVVKKGSGIKSVADLKGKRVALDEPGSGTLINARGPGRLRHQGIRHQARVHQAQPGRRQDEGRRARRLLLHRRRAGRRHCRAGLGRWRHRTAADRRRRRRQRCASQPFFAVDTIAADTYKGVGRCKTLAVGAQWVTSDKADTERSTRSPRRCSATPPRRRWPPATPRASSSPRKTPCKGAGIPFHPGAEKFYKEAGLLK
jgi:TRAP-type uncharacterized transport system substrate-binding protein